jgi:hypothetical protein
MGRAQAMIIIAVMHNLYYKQFRKTNTYAAHICVVIRKREMDRSHEIIEKAWWKLSNQMNIKRWNLAWTMLESSMSKVSASSCCQGSAQLLSRSA